MKKLVSLILTVFHSILFAQEPTSVFYALEEPLLVGSVNHSDHISMEADQSKLVKTMNQYMSETNPVFDSVYIDKTDFDQKKFYFLVFKTKLSNKTLIRWLSRNGANLIIENTQEQAYTALNTYFTCEGEQSCYPRLKKMKDRYYWSCREEDGCVNEEYAKAHPCSCTKSVISK